MPAIDIRLPDSFIQDLITTARNGAIDYWGSLRLHDEGPLQHRDTGAVIVEERDDETQEVVKTFHLTYMEICAGVQNMLDKYPKAFAKILSGQDPEDTADLFIQFCCFRKEKYA